MASQIRLDLRNLAGRKKFLSGKGIELAINKGTLMVIDRLRKNWENGKGGDGVQLEPYSIDYIQKKRKANKLSHGARVDLHWDGHLHKSIKYDVVNRLKRIIRPFGAPNIKKMKGLTTQRNGLRQNIMMASDRIQKIFTDIVFGKLQKAKDNTATRIK